MSQQYDVCRFSSWIFLLIQLLICAFVVGQVVSLDEGKPIYLLTGSGKYLTATESVAVLSESLPLSSYFAEKAEVLLEETIGTIRNEGRKPLEERAFLPVINRLTLWKAILSALSVTNMAEVGVWKGDFAATMLEGVPSIKRYVMADPWRHLENWKKPFNVEDDIFSAVYNETMNRTAPFSEKRMVLRGMSVEVADAVPDNSLDFAYIDGDHSYNGLVGLRYSAAAYIDRSCIIIPGHISFIYIVD